METSASESKEKEGRMCILAGKMCVSVCTLVNWPMMVLVLFMKNVVKSSGVRVDEGGGGLRREEKVLKSMRELDELLILL